MAWQRGILGLTGTVGGLTFCRDGVVRSARRSDKAHFRTAPSLARTRENAAEFGTASGAARLLRHALRPLLAGLHTRPLCGRLTSAMRAMLALDPHPHRTALRSRHAAHLCR